MQLSFIFKKKKHIINITLQWKTLHQKPLPTCSEEHGVFNSLFFFSSGLSYYSTSCFFWHILGVTGMNLGVNCIKIPMAYHSGPISIRLYQKSAAAKSHCAKVKHHIPYHKCKVCASTFFKNFPRDYPGNTKSPKP